MQKLTDEIAYVCYVHCLELYNLLNKQKLGLDEDLNKNVELNMEKLPYNARSHQKTVNTE